MRKTAPTSRIHLIAAAQGVGKTQDPAIRRFRLARVRTQSRPTGLSVAGRVPGA